MLGSQYMPFICGSMEKSQFCKSVDNIQAPQVPVQVNGTVSLAGDQYALAPSSAAYPCYVIKGRHFLIYRMLT